MNEGYISFKKKILKNHVIRWLVLSLSLFLILFGVLLLLNKLKTITLSIPFIILIGIGSALVLFLFGFLIFKPNDKKIAKRLDKEFELKNRVQTMIELKDKDGLVIELQREDTEDKLKNIPLKNLKFKAPALLIVCALLGLGTTVSAAVIPGEKTNIEDQDQDKIYTTTELQIQKIEELKKQVNSQNIEDSLKESYIRELDTLISTLSKGIKESELETEVLKIINNVLEINNSYSSNKVVGASLDSIEEALYSQKNITSVLNKGAIGNWKNEDTKAKISITSTIVKYNGDSYIIDTTNTDTSKIVASTVGDNSNTITITLDTAKYCIKVDDTSYTMYEPFTYYRAIGRNIYNYSDNLSNLISFLKQDYSTSFSTQGGAVLLGRISLEANAINEAIKASKIETDNAYYIALSSFAKTLETASNGGTGKLVSSLTSALEELEKGISEVYAKETNSYNTAVLVDTTLRSIFGLEERKEDTDKLKDDDDATINNDDSGSSESKKDQSLVDGGYGKGDPVYASNDKFFNIDSDGNAELTEDNNLYAYAHFYAEYKSMYENLVNEGTLSEEEIIEYLEVYFNKLANGLDKK